MNQDSPLPRKIVPVLVPMPAERAYSYALPLGRDAVAGSIVQVPLGPREVFGVVWDGEADAVDPKKLKSVTQIFDCPPLNDEMRRFIEWIADYTISPLGLVARMALRAPAAFDPEPPVAALVYTGHKPERLTSARSRVLELAQDGMAWTRTGLAHAAGVSATVIDGLHEQGVFESTELPAQAVVPLPDPDYGGQTLSDGQKTAADELAATVSGGGFSVTLIDGITGSGKTEVYFEAIAAALKAGKQVLILLPEIALTHAFLERFQDRFGAKPAEWHSDLAPRVREKVWRQAAEGGCAW